MVVRASICGGLVCVAKTFGLYDCNSASGRVVRLLGSTVLGHAGRSHQRARPGHGFGANRHSCPLAVGLDLCLGPVLRHHLEAFVPARGIARLVSRPPFRFFRGDLPHSDGVFRIPLPFCPMRPEFRATQWPGGHTEMRFQWHLEARWRGAPQPECWLN